MGKLIKRSFYNRPPLTVAQDILGCYVFRSLPSGEIRHGRIVEVEAYLGPIDPAAHSFRGPTKRNLVMFGPPGFSYVYFTYGMHYCLNFVTEPKGTPTAILIRGLDQIDHANGPGRICRELSLTTEHSGLDLTTKESGLWVEHGNLSPGEIIMTSPRIGISVATEHFWRFFVSGSPGVTKNPMNKLAVPAADQIPA